MTDITSANRTTIDCCCPAKGPDHFLYLKFWSFDNSLHHQLPKAYLNAIHKIKTLDKHNGQSMSYKSCRALSVANKDQDEYLDRYAQLSQQSEDIRQRLSTSSPFSDLSAVESISPTYSPSRRRSSGVSQQAQAYSFPFAHVWPMPQAVPDAWKAPESERVDEAQLFEINHQIKCLLTELLNCDWVKSDKMYRAWVQARLMDAEHELKRQRRRRSSAAQETVRTISLNIGMSPIPGCRSSF